MYLEGISTFLLPHPPKPLDTDTKFCVLKNRTCVACFEPHEIILSISTSQNDAEDLRIEDIQTLGSLWFKTTANSRPSGEKAETSAPLDLTGWQDGVRRDKG